MLNYLGYRQNGMLALRKNYIGIVTYKLQRGLGSPHTNTHKLSIIILDHGVLCFKRLRGTDLGLQMFTFDNRCSIFYYRHMLCAYSTQRM